MPDRPPRLEPRTYPRAPVPLTAEQMQARFGPLLAAFTRSWRKTPGFSLHRGGRGQDRRSHDRRKERAAKYQERKRAQREADTPVV
jgi:hypothetical protein